MIQHLIHGFKYNGNRDIGMYLGGIMGKMLSNAARFKQIDALVPLPLYAGKERKRGFNQAAILCSGMAQTMNIPVITGNVVRKRYTETQTKKHRLQRWENVAESFTVTNPGQLEGKHILLVDDVITTGATLEACGKQILQVHDVRLSVSTLAYASK